jgi:hypothetical protein
VESTTEQTGSSRTNDNSETADDEPLDTKWTEEFVKQAAIQFEQNMQSILSQSKQSPYVI